MNLYNSIMEQHQRQLLLKQENLIKDALVKNGVDVTDLEFLKNNVSRIIKEGDNFEHYYLYYGTTKQVRLISIQKTTDFTANYSDRQYMITGTRNYY